MSLRALRVVCAVAVTGGAAVAGAAEPARPASTPPARAPQTQVLTYEVGGARRQAVVFVPSKPGPKPLVLLFDPNGNAQGAVNTWMPAANRAGWVVASTPQVRNGTSDADDAREMLGLLVALKQLLPVDGRRIYTGGSSGGGCGAYLLALTRSDVFAGAFVQVAHMGSWREHRLASRISRFDQGYYLFTRSNDFNRQAMRQLASALESARLEVTLVEQPGGHQGMTAEEVAAALDWMQRHPARQ